MHTIQGPLKPAWDGPVKVVNDYELESHTNQGWVLLASFEEKTTESCHQGRHRGHRVRPHPGPGQGPGVTILGILDACELCFHCDEIPEGNYGIHQRPFEGREHPLCDVCAREDGPSCEVIWRDAAAKGRA